MAKIRGMFWLIFVILLGGALGSSATGSLGPLSRGALDERPGEKPGALGGNYLTIPEEKGNVKLPEERHGIMNRKNALWTDADHDFGSLRVVQDDPSDSEPDVDCREVKKQRNDSAQCQFVKATDDCDIDEGFLNYTKIVYCTFTDKLLPLAILLLVLWWLFLFIGLAVAADDFFCPSLVVMSKTLGMSDNIAGVTLMAFGNGAPDVFSAIAAVGSMKNGDAGLAVGALVGAGIFVTTVVAGSVAIVRPFHAMERPFLRDIVFYLIAVFMTFFVLYSGITLGRAVSFIGVYIAYVIVVIVGRYIYQRHKRHRQQLLQADEDDVQRTADGYEPIGDDPRPKTLRKEDISDMAADMEDDGEVATFRTRAANQPVLPGPGGDTLNTESDGERARKKQHADNLPDTPQDLSELTPLIRSSTDSTSSLDAARDFLSAVCPINVAGWKEMRWYAKIYAVYKIPVDFLLRITIPVVELSEDNQHWNRHLNCLHCIISPLTILFCANHKAALTLLGGVFPVWVLVVLIGALLAVIVYCTSTNNTPPPYHRAFAFLGFITAVFWIEAIANEIVNLLQTFGILFSISNAILGLTLLAWGNSLGDLVADTTMAKQGFPKTGISACFGGPLFNLLMGIGIPFTIKTVSDGPLQVDLTVIQVLLLATLTISLLSSLIILPLIGFNLNRYYGFYLYGLYLVFLVLAILIETDVIKGTL